MNIALWIVQVLVALAFLAAGAMKVAQPKEALVKAMSWTGEIPFGLVRFIGVAEILGALGLIIPAVTKVAPALTPIAAIGLALVMLLAVGFHVSRKEYSNIAPNIVLLLLALFIVIGRFSLSPITG